MSPRFLFADWHHVALGIRPIQPFAEVLGGVHPQLKELDDWVCSLTRAVRLQLLLLHCWLCTQMDVELDGLTIRKILDRDEIAGAKEGMSFTLLAGGHRAHRPWDGAHRGGAGEGDEPAGRPPIQAAA